MFSSPVGKGRSESDELFDLVGSSPAIPRKRGRTTPVFSESDDDNCRGVRAAVSLDDAAATFLQSPSQSPPLDPPSDIPSIPAMDVDLSTAAAAWNSSDGSSHNTPSRAAVFSHLETSQSVPQHVSITDMFGVLNSDTESLPALSTDITSASIGQALVTDVAALFDSEDDGSPPDGPSNVDRHAEGVSRVPPPNITELGAFLSDDDDSEATSSGSTPSHFGQGPYTPSSFANIPDEWLGDI